LVSRHFNLAWIGFDTGLWAALVMTAVTASEGSKWIDNTATAAAVLVVVDAWFDVVTAPPGVGTVPPMGEALQVELPLASCASGSPATPSRRLADAPILRSVHRQDDGPGPSRRAGDP
jgi:hypothetical protein